MSDSSETAIAATPDGHQLDGRSGSRRRTRWMVAALAVVLIAALGTVGVLGTRLIGVWGPSATAAVEILPPEPTEAPSPFDGTPAEHFAEGADGIVLPEAEPVGDFTAEEVAEALELVRDALIAARLDPTMLIDHDPDHFLSLLAADQQPTVSATFASGDFDRFATQIASDTGLILISPRVEGHVFYEVTTAGARDTPIIEVSSKFTWVYALQVAEGDHELIVVRDEVVWEIRLGRPWQESSQGLWLPIAASSVWGADCNARGDGFLRPAQDTADELADDQDSIYDSERPVVETDEC